VESVSSLGVASLSCGSRHVLALTSACMCMCVWIASKLTGWGAAAGDVYAWGNNGEGRLGLGHATDAYTPQLVAALADKSIVRVVSCTCTSAAITGAFSLSLSSVHALVQRRACCTCGASTKWAFWV
jgi:hypothetical protein